MSNIQPERNSVKIPALEELQALDQWVTYRYPEKLPLNPRTGRNAGTDKPHTWSSHEAACKAVKTFGHHGTGVVVTDGDPYAGIDCDDCRLGDYVEPVVLSWRKRFNSFSYVTPGKHGERFIVRGKLKKAITPSPFIDPFEAYDHGRYFTITDQLIEGTPSTIEDRQQELDDFYQVVMANRKTKDRWNKELRQKIDTLKTAGEGQRNSELAKVAFRAGVLIEKYGLRQGAIEAEIWKACEKNGLAADEPEQSRKTLSNQLQAGKDKAYQEYKPEPPKANNGNGHHPPGNPTITAEDLCSFDADDAGNADAMHALYGQDFLYCASVGWLHYVGTHWGLDADGAEVKTRSIETLRRRRHAAVDAEKEAIIKCTKADERRVNGCVNLFKTHVSTPIDSFDSDPHKLNCKNGVVDLRTGAIEPHSRVQRFTYCVPVEYMPTTCSEWIDYLHGVVGGGQEVIDYLQMALGYSLTGDTREEILFYLFGPPRSGKGTLAEVFMALLPHPISTMVDFNSFTAKREGDVSNFDLAPLKPARLIFASESNRSQSLNPAKIKQLTGGDHISACFKHRDFFSYRPQFKVWMMSNHTVNGDPEDDALWGRVRVIEFPNSFLGREDKSKKARLKDPEALQGVLYWAVQGAIKWYALGPAGLTTPKAIASITQAQRNELDYVQQWLEECCDDDPDGWQSNEAVSISYTAWCKNNNVQYIKGPQALSHSLKAKGYQIGQQRKVAGKNKKGVEGLYIYPIEKGNGNDGND